MNNCVDIAVPPKHGFLFWVQDKIRRNLFAAASTRAIMAERMRLRSM